MVGLILFTVTGPVRAQEPVGTIVVAHGGGEEWNRLVTEVVAQTRTGGPVEVSFLMGPGARSNRFQDIARKMEESGVRRIVVVPLLISSHSGHYEQIRYLAGQTPVLSEAMLHHLHMSGLEPARVRVPIVVARAMDDAPDVAEVLAARARLLVTQPDGGALFLIAHGPNAPEDVAIWMKNLRTLARRVQAETGLRDVRVGIVQDDAAPSVRAEAVQRVREIIELQYAATQRPVAVVPVLISQGSLTREKLPADLLGLPIHYDGQALLPHPGVARWIETRSREAASAVSSHPR